MSQDPAHTNPTGQNDPAPDESEDHSSTGGLLDIVASNLRWLITGVLGVIAAAVVGLWGEVDAYAIIAAACAVLVLAVLLLLWLKDPSPVWRADAARRGVAIGTCAVVAVGSMSVGALLHREMDRTKSATLFLLDASAGMNRVFGEAGSILDAAADEVANTIRTIDESVNVGLAVYGTQECSVDPVVNVPVELALDQGKAVSDQAMEVAKTGGTGKSNVVEAIIRSMHKVGDFSGYKRVVVVTGGADECGGSQKDLDAARERLSDIFVDFPDLSADIVAAGEDAAGSAVVEIASGLNNVTVTTAETPEELTAVMQAVVYDKQVRQEVEMLNNYVQEDLRTPLNTSLSYNKEGKFAEARLELDQARAVASRGEERFDAYLVGDGFDSFAPFKDALRRQFDTQVEWSSHLEKIIDFDAEHLGELSDAQREERNELVEAANEVVGEYNDRLGDLGTLFEEALAGIDTSVIGT